MISDLLLVGRGLKRIVPRLCDTSAPQRVGYAAVNCLAKPFSGFLNQPPAFNACALRYTKCRALNVEGRNTALYYDLRRSSQQAKSIEENDPKEKNIDPNGTSSQSGRNILTSRSGQPQKRHFSTSHRLQLLSAEDLKKAKELKSARIHSKVEASKIKLQSRAKERHVPSSRLERVVHFGGGAVKLAGNVAYNRIVNKAPASDPILRSIGLREADVEDLVTLLCKMRGAALKLGQFLSIQDDNFISPELAAIFERVRQTADYMPRAQLIKQLNEHLPGWETKFKEFDLEPFAAASIGQVHRARLHNDQDVAVKVQYPGVASSFHSDLDNLVLLLKPFKLPETLFVPKLIDFARRELTRECDYVRELEANIRMKDYLKDDDSFVVPTAYPELSSDRVLTTDFVEGDPIDRLDIDAMPQEERDFIGQSLLRLCIRETFLFRFMQTDPNFSNFLYLPGSMQLNLIDMGACLDYPERFTTPYMELVYGAVMGDRDMVYEKSKELGFLTGHESAKMVKAHVNSVMIVGQPYQEEPFDFFDNRMARDIAKEVPTMFEGRLVPPPEETYTLHRKLMGGFLMCGKVRAKVSCRADFIRTLRDAGFDDYANKLE